MSAKELIPEDENDVASKGNLKCFCRTKPIFPQAQETKTLLSAMTIYFRENSIQAKPMRRRWLPLSWGAGNPDRSRLSGGVFRAKET